MIKLMLLIRRKEGLGREEFIDYYETRHVPLIRETLGPCMVDYRRNFVVWDDPLVSTAGINREAIGFDVITEILLEDRAAMDRMFARAADPVAARLIADDEEQFVDRAASRILVVDVREGGV